MSITFRTFWLKNYRCSYTETTLSPFKITSNDPLYIPFEKLYSKSLTIVVVITKSGS